MSDKRKSSSKHTGILGFIRKIFSYNIGTILSGVLLLYMLLCGVLYLTSSTVESYMVTSGPLSRNDTYTGLALYEESVYTAQSAGYVTYYAREGAKINSGGAVYGISSSQSQDSTQELSAEDLASIRSEMLNFSKSFHSSSFNSTYNFKYSLEGDILNYAGVTGNSVSSSDSDEEDEGATQVVSYAGKNITKADTDGIVIYGTDGYESKSLSGLTGEDFNKSSYHKTDLKTDGSVSAGDEIYKLITDENWSLVIPLSDKQAADLEERTSVRVKFEKDGMTQSGDFSIIEIDGAKYGQIDFSKGLIRYASDRFLDIELVTNTVTGLKIPLSSIVTKEFYLIPASYATKNEDSGVTGFMVQESDDKGQESLKFVTPNIYATLEDESAAESDGSENSDEDSSGKIYYVDKSSFHEGDIIVSQKDSSKYTVHEEGVLEGVYCINQGYAVFRRIEILDQNEEYAIVSKGTSYGLSKYDRIARNADKVSEDEILY